MPRGLSYRDAGVDIEEQDRLVERIRARVGRRRHPGVLAGVGGFASLFSLRDAGDWTDPVLVSGTDGVGTKLDVAHRAGRHGTIGIDLVAMCVNDVATSGARPLFFLDYFATGALSADVAAEVVGGIADACDAIDCALVGGETAEMPGLYAPGTYDLAGFAVGIVERSAIIDGARAEAGDVLIGVHGRGLHSNGYSLARRALFDRAGLDLDAAPPELGAPLGDVLLTPTPLYPPAVAALVAAVDVRAIAHITGGGIPGNLPRVLPTGLMARIDRSTWTPAPIFELIRSAGEVEPAEMFRTFNMGLGLIVVVPPSDAEAARAVLAAAGHESSVIGVLEPHPDGAEAEPEVDLGGEP